MSQPPNRRILVIDDTPAIHEDFRTSLVDPEAAELAAADRALFGDEAPAVSPQFEIESAYQGQQALEHLRTSLGSVPSGCAKFFNEWTIDVMRDRPSSASPSATGMFSDR